MGESVHSGQSRLNHDELKAWLVGRDIVVTWPAQIDRETSRVAENVTTDHGRIVHGLPVVVLAPGDEAGVAACFAWLRERELPYVLRGMGHCSGGQSVIDGGVMIDLRRLTGIVHDDPERGQITVRAGSLWLTVCDHLAPQGRRPVSLTTNIHSTVGGTLAVGGFGDTTHIHGLQISSVLALTLVTPDGQRLELTPDDMLFQYSLAGRGQLGAITCVTLRTLVAPYRLAMRRLEWRGIGHFVRDALIIRALGIFDFMRVRVFWREGNSVEGVCARFTDGALEEEPGFELLEPAEWTTVGDADLLEHLRTDASETWTYACPALEMVLPLPSALATWDQTINPRVCESGIAAHLTHGAALVLTPRQALPLAPTPDADVGLMIALRPVVRSEDAAKFVPDVKRIAADAVNGGGRIYLMSVEPDRDVIARQFGDAWETWKQLKAAHDPSGLCNPGLLAPAATSSSASESA